MMSETTNEDRMYPIEMTLQGARCCISIGKGVIKPWESRAMSRLRFRTAVIL